MLNEHSFAVRFVLCALALWRLVHLFTAEDGPWDVVVRVRKLLGDSVVGKMMDCFYCTSLWLALPFAFVVAERAPGRIVSWLALSGAASLLERVTSHEDGAATTPPSLPPPTKGQG
jgi:hypothetical protein